MTLSNVEVHRALDEGRLRITPQPLPRLPRIAGGHCPYDTHSIDLRLGDEIHVPREGSYAYDHTQKASLAEHISRNSIRYKISQKTPFNLEKGQFILGITHEEVELPIVEGAKPVLRRELRGRAAGPRPVY